MLSALARNIAAGARLALGLPVRRLSFRIDVAQLLLVFLVSSLIDIAGDWVRYGPNAQFSWLGAGNELFSLGLLIAAAALIAVARRRASLAIALPVIVLASAPLIQAADVALTLVLFSSDIPQFAMSWLVYVIPAWFIAMIVRSVWIAFEGEGRRNVLGVIAAVVVVAAPTWLAPSLFPSLPWWQSQSSSDAGASASPAGELVQVAQQQLLDNALDALADERPAVRDLYFIGFGADAREPALHEDVRRARRVMDERWDTRQRSIVLDNNPQTLLDTPFATVTHLREALREIGVAIDAQTDVVMLYIAGRGGAAGVEVSHPPLDLLPLSATSLRALLDEAGIKWRIIVVSACRSSAFHEALSDESTVVLTAGDNAGCAIDQGGSALGEALFVHGLAERDSFADAIDSAARATSPKDSKRSLTVGSSIADVLKALDRGKAARRNGRSV